MANIISSLIFAPNGIASSMRSVRADEENSGHVGLGRGYAGRLRRARRGVELNAECSDAKPG